MQNNLSASIFKEYSEKYSLGDYLFKVVSINVKERGYLIFDEFYDICMWKSARQKNNYLRNINDVENCTKEVLIEDDEEIKIKKLCNLQGVGIPTASAILTIINPEKYAVIDIRCLNQLKDMKYSINPESISIKTWISYLKIMRELGEKYNLSPRLIDQALFAMHRESQKKKDYENLYPSN